jgi:hypothetical protein
MSIFVKIVMFWYIYLLVKKMVNYDDDRVFSHLIISGEEESEI